MSSFHNTIELEGEELLKAEDKAIGLEGEILLVFGYNPQVGYTPWQIYEKLNGRHLIGSVRRAITNLTKRGILEKSDERVESKYSKNYTWKLAS